MSTSAIHSPRSQGWAMRARFDGATTVFLQIHADQKVPQLHPTHNSIFIIDAAVPSPQIQSVQVTLTPPRASSQAKLFSASRQENSWRTGQKPQSRHSSYSRFNPTIFTTQESGGALYHAP